MRHKIIFDPKETHFQGCIIVLSAGIVCLIIGAVLAIGSFLSGMRDYGWLAFFVFVALGGIPLIILGSLALKKAGKNHQETKTYVYKL